MPTLKNMSYRTISVELSEGRSLTLGPRESKDVPADDLASEELRRRILDDELYVLPSQSAEPAPPPAPPPPAKPQTEKNR
ncbi:MAG: hypothetical protein M3416_21600 [Acidobacteriota bacterium]|nr:hypothetical protein [Acidobacteriota bacterium]